MIVRCGNWDLNTEKKTMYGHIYFLARQREVRRLG